MLLLRLRIVKAQPNGSFPKWFACWMAFRRFLQTGDRKKAHGAYIVWTAPLLSLMGDPD